MTDRDRDLPDGTRAPAENSASESHPPFGAQSDPSGDERRVRRRWEITGEVNLTIYVESEGPEGGGESSKLRLIREGVTKDLSVTGACVLIENSALRFPLHRLVGRNVKLRLGLPARAEDRLGLLGRIVWAKEVAGLVRIGVQFVDVGPAQQKVLEQWCRADEGELNRLSHLWELLVAEPLPDATNGEGL
jgi:hypothetical protein